MQVPIPRPPYVHTQSGAQLATPAPLPRPPQKHASFSNPHPLPSPPPPKSNLPKPPSYQQIAGLNCLRLISDTAATAIVHGVYKTDLPEDEAVHVAFVDVGAGATQVRPRPAARFAA